MSKAFIAIFCGPPCSGKSTLIEAVRRADTRLSCRSMDGIRTTNPDLAGPINDKARRSAAYRILHRLASGDLLALKPVALDATYIPFDARAEIAAIALRRNVPLKVIQCVCTGDEAVLGFVERDLAHAGADLTVKRVRDLADSYEPFDRGLVVNRHAMAKCTPTVVSAVLRYLETDAGVNPIQWAQHDYVPRNPNASGSLETRAAQKLSERTVRAAKRALWGYRLGLAATVSFAALSVPCLLWPAIRWGLRGEKEMDLRSLKRMLFEPAADISITLGVYLIALSGVFAIVVAYLRDIRERRDQSKTIARAGRVPHYTVGAQSVPSDTELYHAYVCRLKEGTLQRMPLRNCPVFFQIPPQPSVSFRAIVSRLSAEDEVQKGTLSVLEEEAGEFGLDWRGFAVWRAADRQGQYLKRPSSSTGVRCIGLRDDVRKDCWVVEGTRLSYYEMTCREHSVDLIAPSVLPDMRRLLEGKAWDEGELDPSNVRESAKRYSMWVSVTGLVLTKDDYFILQRRSGAVAAGIGSIAASLNGGVDWFKDCDDLQMAALRELKEEVGLCPVLHILPSPTGPAPPRDRPFIGAAYNLRYGRDLNFYCCFATPLRSSEVAEMRKTFFFERTRARDAWEVENLVFLRRDRVTISALESGDIDRILPNRARHLAGALYAWAKYSERENQR